MISWLTCQLSLKNWEKNIQWWEPLRAAFISYPKEFWVKILSIQYGVCQGHSIFMFINSALDALLQLDKAWPFQNDYVSEGRTGCGWGDSSWAWPGTASCSTGEPSWDTRHINTTCWDFLGCWAEYWICHSAVLRRLLCFGFL